MDPVSLGAGLVGLASLFSTCIEGFECLNAARNLGRDYELKLTQFEVEKTRLLIWGESMGLLQEDEQIMSRKLTSPLAVPTIERTLNCIHMLLTDTQKLKSRYGLKELSLNEASDTPIFEPGIGSLSMSRFQVSYRSFCARTKEVQHDTTMMKKARWAIHDRAQFGSLIDDLRQFINGLCAITESTATIEMRARLIKEEVQSIKSATILSLLADSTADYHRDWSDATSEALEASEMDEDEKRRISEWVDDTQTHQEPINAESLKIEDPRHSSGIHSDTGGINPYVHYFVPGYMISRRVMFSQIPYLCGPQATVRPFSYQQREGYLVQNSYHPLTKSQIEDLQYLSRQYEEQQAAKMASRDEGPKNLANTYPSKSILLHDIRFEREGDSKMDGCRDILT